MLERMWSPTGLFDEIKFHNGINLIIGRYAGGRRRDQSDINGIGKSSIVRMIDFLLLAEWRRHTFSQPEYAWIAEAEHSACLKLAVSGRSIQIRRSFGKTSDEVALRIDEASEELMSVRGARALLGEFFFPPRSGSIGSDGGLRRLLPFYVKDDLSTHKRHDPVKFMTHGGGNQRESTILSLYLLGLPNEGLVKLEGARTAWDGERKTREHLKVRIEEETSKTLEVLRTELVSAESRLSEITKAVRDFNLFEGFEDVSTALSALERDASEQRKLATQARRQLEKLRRFVAVTEEIDTASVVQQYEDVSAALGAAVRKSLEEVIEFRKSLARQRLQFHGKRLVELDRTYNGAIHRLGELERQRSGFMKAVNTTDFHETFDAAIQRLATEHGDIERYRTTLSQIKSADDRISNLELLMQNYRHEAALALREVEKQIDRVRGRYIDVVHNAITTSVDEGAGAAMDIESQSGSSAKALPVKISVSLPKVDALGFARLLLVAYDLTVLLHQVEEDLALPRFLIQDGVFHGIARRIVVKTLNYVHRQATEAEAEDRPFQYIATFNVDELSSAAADQVRDGVYEFDLKDVTAATVSDAAGNRFFKREF